ncbi:MAG: GNAT family N-acetyltransferase [Candidatus Dadabacteria bacterium]|nr:GNAT family N-acetyltransferase [Candidatus Dadabacteria bacterium]NIQ14152.1 GNAT family N-acetyltransferase [Candidatus Dadabacteria bacterium]
MNIRIENEYDLDDVYKVNIKAFESSAEARLVNKLRTNLDNYISIVAELDQKIVGHIFFSPVELNGYSPSIKLMGLAPMAVIPEYQNKGIGSKLVEEGLKYCEKEEVDAVFVLGHPDYYIKFGFVPSVNYGIKSEYNVPDDVFMVLELHKGILKNKSGTIKYNKEFNYL